MDVFFPTQNDTHSKLVKKNINLAGIQFGLRFEHYEKRLRTWKKMLDNIYFFLRNTGRKKIASLDVIEINCTQKILKFYILNTQTVRILSDFHIATLGIP